MPTQMDALERGPSGAVSWKNPDSGRYGTIVLISGLPGAAGRNCRSFTTVYVTARPQTARGTCRNPDGTWTTIGSAPGFVSRYAAVSTLITGARGALIIY